MNKIIGSFFGAAILVAASTQTHAQGTLVFDQQSATGPVTVVGNGNADGLDIQTDPLTQSFVPTLSAIGFVQFELADIPGNGNNGATVYVNLWTGSPNINTATLLASTTPVYMPNGFVNSGLFVAGVTNFYFAVAIALTPGQTYYIQPVVQSGDNPWDIITIGNTYQNGQLYGRGDVFQPSTDLWFREGIVVPEPTALALIGLGGLLILVRTRCRSALLILGLSLGGIARADVYYLQSYGGVGSVPFPCDPCDASVPVEQVSPGVYVVEDNGPVQANGSARATRSLQAMSGTSTPLSPGTDNGTNNGYQPNGGGYSPTIFTNGLWLETLSSDPTDTNLWLVLHGTSDDHLYQLLSVTNLSCATNWNLGELLWGDYAEDQTHFSPVPKTGAMTFYRAQNAPWIMQIWNIQNAKEPDPTNNDPGQTGIVGIQNGVYHPATNDLTVYYTISGTARNGIDYSNLPGVLTIPAGQPTNYIVINPIADGLKPDQSIILTLLQNSNYVIDPGYIFTTNILRANPQAYPTARGDHEWPYPNEPWTFSLGGYDDFKLPLSYLIQTWPAHGTLDTNALPQVTYTSTNCYEGQDSFTFTVSDGLFTSAPTNVTLIISDPVTADPVSAPTVPGQQVGFALSGGDSCGEGVSYALPSTLPHGNLNTNALPYLAYTATDTNFTGIASFNYTVTSACGGDSATSTVTLYVAGGPNLAIGCSAFAVGHFVPLEWFLGTNELQMQQQFNCISGFKLYRAAVSGGPYTCIYTNTDLNQTSYLDTNVVVGGTNYYVVTFEFSYSSFNYESPFSNEIKAVVPDTYDLIPSDAVWDVWNITTNQPRTWLGYLQAPFSNVYPNQYGGLQQLPNTSWPENSTWSNNIVLFIPTNIVDLSEVKYSIAIDNDYWLYLNDKTPANFIDATNHGGMATWPAFKTLAPGLHYGTNNICVVIKDEGVITFFSMVVTTNSCDQ